MLHIKLRMWRYRLPRFARYFKNINSIWFQLEQLSACTCWKNGRVRNRHQNQKIGFRANGQYQ